MAIKLFFYVRAKHLADDLRKDLNAAALVPPKLDSKKFAVEKLPNIISAHHFGMPPELAVAPMRLLYIESVISWASLKVFEDVDARSDCLVIPYADVSEEQWSTWRW